MNLVFDEFKTLKNLKISIALKINIFLLCLLPLVIISGPALSDIIISINGLFFIIYVFIHKEFKYIFNKFSLIFFLWCMYFIFLSLNSNYILLSLESSIFYFRFGFFALSTWYILDKVPLTLNFIFYSVLLCFIILFIDSIIQFFSGFNLLGFPYTEERISSFFGKEKVMGSFLSRLLPLFFAISLFLFGNNFKNHLFLNIVTLLILILVLLAGERSAFFYLLLFMLLISVFLNFRMQRLLFFLLSAIIIIGIAHFYEPIKQRMYHKTLYQVYYMSNDFNMFSIEHDVIYRSAFKMFLDKPILGIGPKTFREECKKEKYKSYIDGSGNLHGCQLHPHNTYVQLLAETGIVGAFPIIILFLVLVYNLIKHFFAIYLKKQKIFSDYQICLFFALLITLWPIIPTGNFFNNWLSIIYYLPIGFILSTIYSNKKNENH